MTDYSPDPSLPVTHGDVVSSLAQSCGIDGPEALRIQDDFAPRLARAGSGPAGIDVLLSVVGRCVDARHPIAYLSVPLTTGRAYIELRARHAAAAAPAADELSAERDRTMETNKQRAFDAARRLRAVMVGTVIDPSRLADVPGWEQPDYHAFWTRVIGQYAEQVFFLDGWQYSVGCTIEFSKAVKMGLPTMTADRALLDPRTGCRLVREALAEYAQFGLDPEPLRDALSVTSEDLDDAASRPRSR